jgi:integrase
MRSLLGSRTLLWSGGLRRQLRCGAPVDPDAITRWLRSVGSTIGISVSPHRLRHTSATLMFRADVVIETVGKRFGHRDVPTTSIHARVLDEKSFIALDELVVLLQPPDT